MEGAEILVVEDEAIIAKHLQKRLQRMGYRVPSLVASGEEAVAVAEASRPDLVLMDIILGGAMDGIEAARQIWQRCDIPVIYLTAHTDDNTLERAKETGPFGYITKPFEDKELGITIQMALYKHRMERQLKEREGWLSTTLRSIGDAVIATDAQARVSFMNPVAQRLTGWSLAEAGGRPLAEVLKIIDGETGEAGECPATRVIRDKAVVSLGYHRLRARDGEEIPIDDSAAPIQNDQGAILGVVIVFSDITKRRQAEEEREQLIRELQDALAEIKVLKGILPICASCKKIRDDAGYWNQLETYIQKHTDVQFSHGLCHECARRLYPQFFK
ncbi:MAG: response regulator [Thermodesulfobacteriota bacterium]